jgi:prepilin-type N-terminal cleavage/methylation domain-containing protein
MKSNKRGVTLIELIVALAILTVIIAVGFSFYFFGSKTFSRGETIASIQFDVRMSTDFITREVRNATEVELISIPGTFDTNYHYIYIEGAKLKHQFNGTVQEKTSAIIQASTPMFSLEELANGRNQIEFTMKGSKTTTQGIQAYEATTKVFLNNVSGITPSQNQAIKYKKP